MNSGKPVGLGRSIGRSTLTYGLAVALMVSGDNSKNTDVKVKVRPNAMSAGTVRKSFCLTIKLEVIMDLRM